MSKRSKWTDFDKETKKYIKKRDGGRCVICHKAGATQCMHVFLSRAKGGRGCKENGASGCPECHRINDNPIGQKEKELSITNNYKVKQYLVDKENLVVNKEFIDSLRYKKQPTPFELNTEKPKLRCKSCVFLVKNTHTHNSIPSYYCKIKKTIRGKNSEVCNKYRAKK